MKSPQEALDTLLARDEFTRWLGLQIEEIALGYCRLRYTVREEMLNGFDIVHGGVVFSAADSALAFACNSHGQLTVALEVSISFTRPARTGDRLLVEAREVYRGNKTGVYDIRTTNADGELVAVFKGTTYQTSKTL